MAAVRALRLLVYFLLGVLISAVWVGAVVAAGPVPAIVVFPQGSYASQCSAAVASYQASGYCEGLVSYSLSGYDPYPHKKCQIKCDGAFVSESLASADLGCANPLETPYEDGGAWWCASGPGGCPTEGVPATNIIGGNPGEIGWTENRSESATFGGGRCYGGCRVSVTGGACVRGVANQAVFNCVAQVTNSGECDPGDSTIEGPATPMQETETSCLKKGMSFGTVNGTVLCVGGGGPNTETYKRDVKTTTTTPEGGSPTVRTDTKTTTCSGGNCTTTTTTTGGPGGPGGPGGSGGDPLEGGPGEVREEEGQSSYCEENPDAPQCQSACEKDPYGLECLGNPPEPGEVETGELDVPASISAVGFPGGVSCPSASALVWGISVPWDRACQLAGLLRPIVLAFAWLAAGLFVIGGLRNG